MQIEYVRYPITTPLFQTVKSLSDCLGEPMWDLLQQLRGQRKTGRSAKMLFEVLGECGLFHETLLSKMIYLENTKRWDSWRHALHHRLDQVRERAHNSANEMALELEANTEKQ